MVQEESEFELRSYSNLSPAPLALADSRYIALTMREKILYAFWSEDGLNFQELDNFALSVGAFPDAPAGSDGLFDPTLVRLPNGKIFMYVTAGGVPGNDAIVAAELALEWE